MKHKWRDGNSVNFLINGEEFFPRVYECIRAAREEILLETFILENDKVGRALQKELIDAAKRGIRIDITVDDYGTPNLGKEFIAALTEVGVRLHLFDPRPKIFGVRFNLFRRLHRKLIVIDGEVAFIGGINFSAEHLGDFGPQAKQDYAVETRGPIVADIHRTCMNLLIRASTRQDAKIYRKLPKRPVPAPAGDTRMLLSERDNEWHSNDIQRQYLLAMRLAKKRIMIANAYFFPSYRILRELRRAAQRGVEVSLILQGQPDMPWVTLLSRLLYNYLLRAGVVIHEYCERPLHGKIALMDDEWSTVGSSNLDPLSLSLNLETNVIIQDAAFNELMYNHLKELACSQCKPVNREVAKRGYWWRTPLIFLSFHFLRNFPSKFGWLPAHAPELKLIRPKRRLWNKSIASAPAPDSTLAETSTPAETSPASRREGIVTQTSVDSANEKSYGTANGAYKKSRYEKEGLL